MANEERELYKLKMEYIFNLELRSKQKIIDWYESMKSLLERVKMYNK